MHRRLQINLSVILILFAGCQVKAQLSGQALIDSLEAVLAQSEESVLKTAALNKLSFAYLQKDPVKSKTYAFQGLKLAQENKQVKETGEAYNNIACNYTLTSNYDSGIYYFKAALTQYEDCKYEKGQADVLGNLGTLYYYSSNFPTALDHFFKALTLFEKQDNKTGIANTLGGIASLYMELKSYDKALKYDSLALDTYKNLKDADGVALILGNMANILENIGQVKKAESLHLQALGIYDSLGNYSGVARTKINLGLIYTHDRDYQRAKQFLEVAHALFSNLKYPTGIMMAQGNLGVVYKLCAEYYNTPDSVISMAPGVKKSLLKKAEYHLRTAIQIAEETGDLNPITVFAKDLSTVYGLMGRHEDAMIFYKKFVAIRDSVFSHENKLQLEKLGIQRELDLKEKQIEIDRLAVEKKRNERAYFFMGLCLLTLMSLSIYRNYKNQKKANSALTHTLQELRETQDQLVETEKQKENAELRSKISQDIHDDISANLSKISWLVETVKIKSSAQAESPLLETLEKINHFSRETVSKLGEIIWSTNPERDNLESLFAYMRNFLNQYLEGQEMQYQLDLPDEIPNLPLNPELRRNLFLVFKEAVHNAVKYSQASMLKVSFVLLKDSYRMEISDNGLGLTPGETKGSGYGMANMQRRMHAVGGEMNVDSASQNGARLAFSGPWKL